MVNPELLNKAENIYDDGGKTVLNINKIPYFDAMQYDLSDDKDFARYIRDLERTVRNSFEYREFIKYLKNIEGMDECSFLENVSSRDNSKVKIEIHHSPLTLYDICMAVFKKRQRNKEDCRVESVAEEVLYLHYIGWVGLIPLSETVHDMVHNQYLFVPLDKVRGNFREFVNAYYNDIDPEVLDCLDAADTATKEYNNKQMELFNNHDIYINMDGSYELPRRDEVRNSIKSRIDDIKSGNRKKKTILVTRRK